MIQIYKDQIAESDRLAVLEVARMMPEPLWTQSVCTDSPVEQLREYLPMTIFKIINDMHNKVFNRVQVEFDVELVRPTLERVMSNIIAIDRRSEGYYLPTHTDVPTGDYMHHIGSVSGESKITVSCVYYWNDDYEGGELYFPEEDYLYKPKAGDLVVFNSDMIHEILIVKSGVRYSSQYFFDRID